MSNTAALDRAARRDYWTSPGVATVCKALDWTAAALVTVVLVLIGSLNLG